MTRRSKTNGPISRQTHVQHPAPVQTVIHGVPEADQAVLSARQEGVSGRVGGQTPQLVDVTLNSSQHKLLKT